jgi:hypothetical protein
MLNKNLPNTQLTTLQTDLYNIASKHDGILDMIVFGFTQDMDTSTIKHYQEMLNVNFPDQVSKVTETDDGIKSLNFR